MKKILKIIAFQIGVDVLGFPQFHTHEILNRNLLSSSKFFKAHTKK